MIDIIITGSKGCVHSVDLTMLVKQLEFIPQALPMLGCPTGLTCFEDKFVVVLYDYHLSVYDIKYHTLQSRLNVTVPIVSLREVPLPRLT